MDSRNKRHFSSPDFGNRKFDALGAVKLVNGLVKRGQAVNEGDQLWSAVENFASPLGLVRADNPRRLDPSRSTFYQEIRQRVDDRGGAGLEIKTVYNWFTGYDPKDGTESPGLTRRMVDIYLLCLAQQGQIRISDKKGGWIDRSSIGEIEFKPDHLRNLNRIELPRPLPDWQVFSPYIEVLLGRADGSLGPKYDKATADDAIAVLWNSGWLRRTDVDQTLEALTELFSTLGREKKDNPFDELLIYWLEFADEDRPAAFEADDTFQVLCRAVLKVGGVAETSGLTSTHVTTFRENQRRLAELRNAFDSTRTVLLRAARLARAVLPKSNDFKEIGKAQVEVLAELERVADLVVNQDTVTTRLSPRLRRLEEAYVPAYLDGLMTLDGLQGEIDDVGASAQRSGELRVLGEFSDLSEARCLVEKVKEALANLPRALRRRPEDRDASEREIRNSAAVKDAEGEPLTFRRLAKECSSRRQLIQSVATAPKEALQSFVAFLRSPRILERLRAVKDPTKTLTEVLQTKSDDELVEVITTLPAKELNTLAKLLTAVVVDKRPKTVRVTDFAPHTEFVWEDKDMDALVAEFREYIKKAWEDGCYLKIERE